MRTGDLPTYRAMLRSEDAAEGVRAFVEKRAPVFKGHEPPRAGRRPPRRQHRRRPFLARGYDVTAYLHDRAEEAVFRTIVDTAWPSLEALGLAPRASRDRLTIVFDLDAAVADAGFVQDSAPEKLAVKQALYEKLGTRVSEGVVIASSTLR